MSMWLLVLLKKSEENSHEQPFEGGWITHLFSTGSEFTLIAFVEIEHEKVLLRATRKQLSSS